MSTRYILLDTETSGLPPNAGVCEVGWLELSESGTWIKQVDSLIDPECPISSSASGVHGIVDEDVQNSLTLAEFFSESSPTCYGQKITGDPVVLIGHRVSFDRRFVEPFIDGPILECCTLRWVRSLYPYMEDHKLSTTKYALGLRKDAGDAHRVMADVWVTYDLLHHIMGRLSCTLPELVAKSQEPMMLTFMPFGKHKGQLFSEVPRSYLQWMQRELKDLDIDQAYTINYYLNN